MTLTLGPGPLGTSPGGTTNFRIDGPAHRILVEDHPRRIRLRVAGHTIVDTVGARLLHESNLLPALYVPLADVDPDVLGRSDTSTHCPFKGDATYWTVTVGDDVREDLLWGYEDPDDGVVGIEGFVAPYLDRVDEVLVEDEPALGHLRDPYHRVDTLRSSRHVVVRVAGRVVAETDAPMGVFETGLPPRWYVPERDVAATLVDSDTTSTCPYKGVAAYRSIEGGPADVAWSYPDPLPEAQGLEGHWAFWGDDVEVEVTP